MIPANSKWAGVRNVLFGALFVVWVSVGLAVFGGRTFATSIVSWAVLSRPVEIFWNEEWSWSWLVRQAAIATVFVLICAGLWRLGVWISQTNFIVLAVGAAVLGGVFAKLVMRFERRFSKSISAGKQAQVIGSFSDFFGLPAFPWILGISLVSSLIFVATTQPLSGWFGWHPIDAVTLFVLSLSVVWMLEGKNQVSLSPNRGEPQ